MEMVEQVFPFNRVGSWSRSAHHSFRVKSDQLHHIEKQLLAEDTLRREGWVAAEQPAREPTKHPHGPQAPGDMPAPMVGGDVQVTAETLRCRPAPLLLLLAQFYFQKLFADDGPTKVRTVHI